MTTLRKVVIAMEFVVAVSALAGIVDANDGRDRDRDRLETNQIELYKVIAKQSAQIESLSESQAQLREHILTLYARHGERQVAPHESGNLITETVDDPLELPNRATREARSLIDTINPF